MAAGVSCDVVILSALVVAVKAASDPLAIENVRSNERNFQRRYRFIKQIDMSSSK